MSDVDIAVEFWAHRYYGFVLEKGAFPGPGEFDTEEIDAEITRWALEDGEALDHYQALQTDDWEEVDLSGNGF